MYCSFGSIKHTSAVQKEIKNSALTCSLTEDPSIKRRSQWNCRKLNKLTNRKAQGKGILNMTLVVGLTAKSNL